MLNMKNPIDLISMILVIIGALNIGIVAFGTDVLKLTFGSIPILEQIVYIIIGLAGLWLIYAIWMKKK